MVTRPALLDRATYFAALVVNSCKCHFNRLRGSRADLRAFSRLRNHRKFVPAGVPVDGPDTRWLRRHNFKFELRAHHGHRTAFTHVPCEVADIVDVGKHTLRRRLDRNGAAKLGHGVKAARD